MRDTGQRGIGQAGFFTFERHFQGHGLKSYLLGGLADAQQRHPFAADVATLAEVLQGIYTVVVCSDHAQAAGAAVHGVELSVEREAFQVGICAKKKCLTLD
jgi:hypothetical protein